MVGGFDLLDFYQFYKLQEIVRLTAAFTSFTKEANLAYAYCDF